MAAPHVARAEAHSSPAPLDLDARTGEVRTDVDRQSGLRNRAEGGGDADAARRRRRDRPPARRHDAALRRSRRVLVRPAWCQYEHDEVGRADGLRSRRRRRLDGLARAAEQAAGCNGALSPLGHRSGEARPDGADDAARGWRGDRVRRAQPCQRAPSHSVLVRHRYADARRRPRRATWRRNRHVQVDHQGRYEPRCPLPLPGEPGRLRLLGHVAGTGADLPRHACAPGRELRRRRDEPRPRRARRAADRPCRQRAPSDRICRAAVRPQPAYLRTFGDLVLASGTILPAAGAYDVVFDSPSAARAGGVRVPLLAQRRGAAPRGAARTQRAGGQPPPRACLRRRPASIGVAGRPDRRRGRRASFAAGEVRIATAGLRKGRHTLRLQISDYQESRNMENVGRILPSTRILQTTFTVR